MLAADKQTQENGTMLTIVSGCADLERRRAGRRTAALTKALKVTVIKILLAGALMPASGPAASASPQRSPGMAAVTSGLPWHAPLGHRQPRAADLTDAVQPSPADEDQRWIDRAVDRKLSICRGC